MPFLACVRFLKKRKKYKKYRIRIILIIENEQKMQIKPQKTREKFCKSLESSFLL